MSEHKVGRVLVCCALVAMIVLGHAACTVLPLTYDRPTPPNPCQDDCDEFPLSVELNPPNQRLYALDPLFFNYNPSRARGMVNAGYVESAINLPDAELGYYHFYGSDAVDTDDWAVLALLGVIDNVGQFWEESTGFCHLRVPFPPAFRFGVGDLSLGFENTGNFGGYFSGHTSHQNGRDADVRYVRWDGTEAGVDFSQNPSDYDAQTTYDLMQCFLEDNRVQLLIVDPRAGVSAVPGLIVHDDTGGHRHHFHVRVYDPDGENN